MQSLRSKLPLLALAGVVALLALRCSTFPPEIAKAPNAPIVKPVPAKPNPAPGPDCPEWGKRKGRRSPATIVEAGSIGPDGRKAMIDFPAAFWNANIISRGEGCCVERSVDFAARFQNVPVLWSFPEWIKEKNQRGGCYSELLAERISAISKDRNRPEPDYINVESKDFSLVKLVIQTGRLPCVDYSGQDGVHYGGPIAHCVCLVYADDDYVAVLDNNFPPDQLLWMPAGEFKKRWGGWIIALCAPRPPAAPSN